MRSDRRPFRTRPRGADCGRVDAGSEEYAAYARS